jgi:hypothetical protein
VRQGHVPLSATLPLLRVHEAALSPMTSTMLRVVMTNPAGLFSGTVRPVLVMPVGGGLVPDQDTARPAYVE